MIGRCDVFVSDLMSRPWLALFFLAHRTRSFFVLDSMKCISLHCIVSQGDRYLTQEAFVSLISYIAYRASIDR